MTRGSVAVLFFQSPVQDRRLRARKIPPELRTQCNHMMVAAAIILVLVAGDAIMKCDFARQAAFGKAVSGCGKR